MGEKIGGTFAIEASWSTNLRIPLDDTTREALSRDLSMYPDHPLRERQQEVRDAAEKGVDMRRFLAAGNGRWRIASSDRGSSPVSWNSGGADGDSWMWYKTEVTVVDAKQPQDGRHYPDLRFEYLGDLLGFTTGGLADLAPRTRRWNVVEHSGSTWKAVATMGDPAVTFTAVGGWDASVGQGVVHSVTSADSKTEYRDWKVRGGFWTAGSITLTSGSGYRWIHVLNSIATPTNERIVALARTPSPGRPDMLLVESSADTGESTGTITSPETLVDLRGSVPTAVVVGQGGLIQLPIKESSQTAARRRVRWAGWAIGGSLAFLIGSTWMWKHRSRTVVISSKKEHT